MSQHRSRVKDATLKCIAKYVDGITPSDISESMDPFRELGLESIDGIGFACDMSRTLDFIIPKNVNPFVDDTKRCARNVGQIIDYLCAIIGDSTRRATNETRTK